MPGADRKGRQKSGWQFVTVEDTTCVVHMSHGVLEPASESLRSEPAIVAGIARATLQNRTTVDWEGLVDNYDRIREHIEHVVPGFTQYNVRVRQPGGFYLPNPPHDGQFNTPSKRARFTVHPIPEHGLEDGQLLLMTIRSHDQFNTTIYGENDRYRGIFNGRRVVFLNANDISPGSRKGSMGRFDQPLRVGNAPRGSLQGGAVRDSRGLRGRLLPGDQRPRADPRARPTAAISPRRNRSSSRSNRRKLPTRGNREVKAIAGKTAGRDCRVTAR